jgi:GTP pyrophosphokinase
VTSLEENGSNVKNLYDRVFQLDESALTERLLSHVCNSQTLARAVEAACHVHHDALRDEGTHYSCHVLRVALILVEELQITDTELLCAGVLHDVLEDGAEITLAQLRHVFGDRVARTVCCLTDEFKHRGLPRAERKKLYLQRIANADDDCLLVKLCDRLDNLRSLPYSPNTEKREYMKRQTEVYLMPVFPGRSGAFVTLERLLIKALRG